MAWSESLVIRHSTALLSFYYHSLTIAFTRSMHFCLTLDSIIFNQVGRYLPHTFEHKLRYISAVSIELLPRWYWAVSTLTSPSPSIFTAECPNFSNTKTTHTYLVVSIPDCSPSIRTFRTSAVSLGDCYCRESGRPHSPAILKHLVRLLSLGTKSAKRNKWGIVEEVIFEHHDSEACRVPEAAKVPWRRSSAFKLSTTRISMLT